MFQEQDGKRNNFNTLVLNKQYRIYHSARSYLLGWLWRRRRRRRCAIKANSQLGKLKILDLPLKS